MDKLVSKEAVQEIYNWTNNELLNYSQNQSYLSTVEVFFDKWQKTYLSSHPFISFTETIYNQDHFEGWWTISFATSKVIHDLYYMHNLFSHAHQHFDELWIDYIMTLYPYVIECNIQTKMTCGIQVSFEDDRVYE